jgi:L-ascorbate metabolism protein UlaG (beta-lactamase superfamily)
VRNRLTIQQTSPHGSLEEAFARASDPVIHSENWRIYWLGQAGFALIRGHLCVLIDPYLSNSLGVKYAGGRYPHARLMPPPVDPAHLGNVAYVLCSHAHSDHMDPGTLPTLATASPHCTFIVPRPGLGTARERGVPAAQLAGVNAGDTVELGEGVTLDIVPAAHDTLQPDAAGHHPFLGYVLSDGHTRIYHSGDSVDFPGLAEQLAALQIDLALLPINECNEALRQNGIIGNFSFEEAVDLCRRASIPAMIPHHFGMFAENTIDEDELDRKIAGLDGEPVCVKPEIGTCIEVEVEPGVM